MEAAYCEIGKFEGEYHLGSRGIGGRIYYDMI
jgi:hypothetical protein